MRHAKQLCLICDDQHEWMEEKEWASQALYIYFNIYKTLGSVLE